MKVIVDHAPGAIKENVIKNYFGRKIAIDASMSLYQFLIAVRPDDTNTFTLTNDVGETTSYVSTMPLAWRRDAHQFFRESPFAILTFDASFSAKIQASHRFLLPHHSHGRVWHQACLRVRWQAAHFEERRSTRIFKFHSLPLAHSPS